MSKPLLFVEFDRQVADLLGRGFAADARWIALGPSAMYALSAREIPYEIPEDYCGRDQAEAACVAEFDRLVLVCNELDRRLRASDSFLQEWGVEPFGLHLWQLGKILDGIVSRAVAIDRILASHPASDLVTHRPPVHECCDSYLCPRAFGGFWQRVLCLPGWGRPLRVLDLEGNERRAGHLHDRGLLAPSMRRAVKDVAHRNPRLFSVVESLRHGLVGNALRLVAPRFVWRGSGSVLVLKHPYDWLHLLHQPPLSRFRIYFDKPRVSPLPGAPRPCPPDLVPVCEGWFSQPAHPLPVAHIELIQPALAEVAHASPVMARGAVAYLSRQVNLRDIRLVVNAVSADFPSILTLTLLRRLGVPVVKWQHGSVWFKERITQRMDLADTTCADMLLVYGDGVKQAYERAMRTRRCQIVSVGSTQLETIRRRARPYAGRSTAKRKLTRLLYVTTNYAGDEWYSGFSPPMSDRLYFADQRVIVNRLVDLLSRRQDVRVTIKLPPSYPADYLPPWIREFDAMPRVSIVTNERWFAELLPEHDVVLIDSPTTVLLQALSSSVVSFVLLGTIGWPDEAISELRKAAVCEEAPGPLMDRLDQYLASDGMAGEPGSRFLELFGLTSDDGGTAGRVAERLERILRGWKSNPAVPAPEVGRGHNVGRAEPASLVGTPSQE